MRATSGSEEHPGEPTGPPGGKPEQKRSRTNPVVVVAILLLAMAAYFVLIGIRGVFLMEQSRWTLKVLGAAVLAFPLIGIWVVVAELRFGRSSQLLAERMIADGEDIELPDLPRSRAGRVDRAAADAWFNEQRLIVEADLANWRGWFRLAQAYNVAGDRKRARQALRTAIEKAG